MRLLIAEDDRALGMFLTRGLEAEGHRVRVTTDGGSAVNAFREDLPDLTILDLNLPVKDGEQALREMRMVDADLPVLVLTARQEVETRVSCLDSGADDLMTKPFSLHELRARCRVLLRRKREARLVVRAGDLEIDRMNHSAVRGGAQIALTNKEFALLEHLMLNRGQCVTRVELLDTVWKLEPAQTEELIIKSELGPPAWRRPSFRFQGYIQQLVDTNSPTLTGGRESDLMSVPHHWITHEISGDSRIALPSWEGTAGPNASVSTVLYCSSHQATPFHVRSVKPTRPVPEPAVCSTCGKTLRPAKLVWKPDERLCRDCKQKKRS
jgi:DNA-binding response OmpR family regulator